MKFRLILASVALFTSFSLLAQEQETHKHHTEIDRRGDQVMGFDHTRTTHHFYLKSDGGIIQVTANDPADQESISKIRQHLQEISKRFRSGDFTPSVQIHDRIPAGVNIMKERKEDIEYQYQEVPGGARVVITTKNEDARKAIQEFLKFQIQDHRTGDSLDVGAKHLP